MSLAGFKKQINKANQFMSEKIGGAKGTEFDMDFTEMERKTEVVDKLSEKLVTRTSQLLKPNPAYNAKLTVVNSFSKLRGSYKSALYPHPEGLLGECMSKYGKELGNDSVYGEALVDAGECYKHMADIKYILEDNVKHNFIELFQQLKSKDLKEVYHHRKKLEGRRLDFDCKKRKQAARVVSEEEMNNAEEKFEESKNLTAYAMHNLLENDVKYVSQLSALVDAEAEYHQQSLALLKNLSGQLTHRGNEAANCPRREFVRH